MTTSAPNPANRQTCGKCGAILQAGVKFCGECGEPIPAAVPQPCRHCAAILKPAAQFCMACGTPVTAGPGPGAVAPPAPPPQPLIVVPGATYGPPPVPPASAAPQPTWAAPAAPGTPLGSPAFAPPPPPAPQAPVRKPGSGRRAVAVILFLIVAIGGGLGAMAYYKVGLFKPPPVSDVAPTLAPMGEFAQVISGPVTAEIGKDAKTLTLDGGVKITVPAGAFPKPVTLTAGTVELDFTRLSFDIGKAKAYSVSTKEDFERLAAPVVVEIPRKPGTFAFALYDGKRWVSCKPPPGETAKIEIRHFSNAIIVHAEETADVIESLDGPSRAQGHEIKKIEAADPGVKSFFGVGEKAPRNMDQQYREFQSMMGPYRDPAKKKFPPWSSVSNWKLRLGPYLHAAKTPKETGGYYYEATEGSMGTIHAAVISQRGQLSPAQFMRICIEANGGNVPLGVLAAHNYLKDLTYRGRDSWDGSGTMPPDIARAAQHLGSWREGGNLVRGQYYDKMGPLYHIFAAMTAAMWGGASLYFDDLGVVAVNGEAILRALQIGADKPDSEKGAADRCGVLIGSWILNCTPDTGPERDPPPDHRKPESHSVADMEEQCWVIYSVEDKWLICETAWRFKQPLAKKDVLWCGTSNDPAKKVRLLPPEGTPANKLFYDRGSALKEAVQGLTEIAYSFNALTYPRETVVAKLDGRQYHLRLDFSTFDYDINANIAVLRSINKNITPKKTFGSQYLVHATGHGTYYGPVKDDCWMMIPEKCVTPKGFTIADGMGGTFGYSYDKKTGPFTDNYGLVPALRQLKASDPKFGGTIGLYAEDRSVSFDDIPEGIAPTDSGAGGQ